jgi:tetratricopeptide (TPR) repeat protein
MRTACLVLGLLAVFGAAPPAMAQEQPGAVELPARYRGGEIEHALQSRDWGHAEEALVAEIEHNPKSVDLLKVLGRVFLIDRKPLNAAVAFKKAEAIEPLDPGSRFALVLAYISLKKGDWARPELERLTAGDPQNATYQYWLGRLDYDAGQYAEAIRRFEGVIAKDPSFVRAYDNLGLCYDALNQSDQAAAHYRKAVELNRRAAAPEAWPPLNLGKLLRTRGDLDEAEALFREALRYNPQFAQAHYQLGVLLESRGQVDQATTELVTSAELDPEYADPHYALMRIYQRQGRTADAERSLSTFKRLHDQKRDAGKP